MDRLASFPALQCVLLLLVCMHWAPTLAQVIYLWPIGTQIVRSLRNLLVHLASLVPRPLPDFILQLWSGLRTRLTFGYKKSL